MTEDPYHNGAVIKVFPQQDEFKHLEGLEGTVIDLREDNWIGVQFPEDITHGHDLDGIGEGKKCYYIPRDQTVVMKTSTLKKVKPKKIDEFTPLVKYLTQGDKSTKENYDSEKINLEKYEKSLKDYTRYVKDAKEKIATYEKQLSKKKVVGNTDAKALLAKIAKLKGIKSSEVKDGVVSAITNAIKIDGVNIGEYKIMYHIKNNTVGALRLRGLVTHYNTSSGDVRSANHIFVNQSPTEFCFGNQKPKRDRYRREGKLDKLFELSYKMLEAKDIAEDAPHMERSRFLDCVREQNRR